MEHGQFAEMQRQQHEQHMLAIQTGEHELRDFYDSLTKDQLDTMLGILSAFTDSNIGQQNAAMHLGRVRQLLYSKFNVCPCNQDHGVVEDLLRNEAIGGSTLVKDARDALASVTRKPLAKEVDLLREYNVRKTDATDREVQCIGCGLRYISLSDRMIKGPDDCHGCHIKSSQG